MPENTFTLVDEARSYLFIIGGIGITPILSMIRSFDELLPLPWRLFYLSRALETTAFLDELKALTRRGVKHCTGVCHGSDGSWQQ